MYEQIENDVDKKINDKLDPMVEARKELNDYAQTTLSLKQMVKDELTAIMRRFDLDGDAKLTFAEFAEALSPF